jgi:hypothetical protein
MTCAVCTYPEGGGGLGGEGEEGEVVFAVEVEVEVEVAVEVVVVVVVAVEVDVDVDGGVVWQPTDAASVTKVQRRRGGTTEQRRISPLEIPHSGGAANTCKIPGNRRP